MRDLIKYGDYTGFSFNKIHCSQFGLVRVSNGSRYEGGLLPSFENITQQGSREGQFYYGKKAGSRQFSISTAFDSVTETELIEIKQWLSAEIGELIFDERPYIKYYCTLADTPTFNFVAFNQYGYDSDNEEQYIKGRVYKGELSFTLISCEPYGYCVDPNLESNIYTKYGNIREWFKSSGLATTRHTGNYGGQFTAAELGPQLTDPLPHYSSLGGGNWQIWNPGTVEAPIMLNIRTTSGLAPTDNLYIKGGSGINNMTTFIQLSGITASSNDPIIIDTETCTVFINGKLSNDKLIIDNFFNIPAKDLGAVGRSYWLQLSSNCDPYRTTITFTPRFL